MEPKLRPPSIDRFFKESRRFERLPLHPLNDRLGAISKELSRFPGDVVSKKVDVIHRGPLSGDVLECRHAPKKQGIEEVPTLSCDLIADDERGQHADRCDGQRRHSRDTPIAFGFLFHGLPLPSRDEMGDPASHLSAPGKRLGQRRSVHIFEIPPDGDSPRQPSDSGTQGTYQPLKVDCSRLAFNGGVGREDHFTHRPRRFFDPPDQGRDSQLLRTDPVEGGESTAQYMKEPAEFSGTIDRSQFECPFDNTDHGPVSLGVDADLARRRLREVSAHGAGLDSIDQREDRASQLAGILGLSTEQVVDEPVGGTGSDSWEASELPRHLIEDRRMGPLGQNSPGSFMGKGSPPASFFISAS